MADTPSPSIAARLARLPRIEISQDLSALPASERAALERLVHAARCMDAIHWRQIDEGNPGLLERLTGDERDYLVVNKGRWDAFKGQEPFVAPFTPRPKGAAFYPPDMTAAEFEAYVAEHPEERDALQDLHTVVRRENGRLVAIPYRAQYRPLLEEAAGHLRAAADVTADETLRTFLRLRADALLSDDFMESDMAWMDLAGALEVVVGPYEVYDDQLFGYKTSYSSFLTVVDAQLSAKLAAYAAKLPELERALPIPAEHLNLERGQDSPIRIVDLVFAGGDARGPIQTSAFNLPNDERVREAKGTKKVLLRNVLRAKYDVLGAPVARRVLAHDQAGLVAFDAFFTHVLFHELAHGLGPGMITVDGERVETRILLKELYSHVEETKADVVGLWALLRGIDEGWVTGFTAEQLLATDEGFQFRTIRMGIHESHARAAAIQWHWYRERGAIVEAGDGRFRVVFDAARAAVESLATELLMIEATGDYARAERLFAAYGSATPELEAVTAKLDDFPIDFRPVYPFAGE